MSLFGRYGASYRWLAVTTTMLGSLAALLAGTIINVAIPEVMGAFGIDQTRAQWLSAGFLAAGTVTMLLAAWSVRAFGIQATYVTGMVAFMGGSVLGGISATADMLILSRLIQGAASGLVMPLGMLVMYQIFPIYRRGTAMGIFGVGVILAPALGPSLGGFLIDHFGWRYVFYAAVPLSGLSLPLSLLFLPGRDEVGPRPSFDWIGMFLASTFIGVLLIALADGQKEGWESIAILRYFAISAASGIAFVAWEFVCDEPMLDLTLFRNGAFLAAAVVTFVYGAGLYATTYLVPVFLQTVQRVQATDSGLLLAPGGLALAAMFPLSGYLSDRFSPRMLIFWGTVVFAFSCYLMTAIDVNTPFVTLIWWTVIGRLGMGIVMPPLNRASLTAIPMAQLAQGAGAINFLRQLGGAFGVNLFAVYVERRIVGYGETYTAAQTPANEATAELLRHVQEILHVAGIPEAYQFPGALVHLARVIYSQASVMAYRDGFLVLAGLFVLTLVPILFMSPEVVGARPRGQAASSTQYAGA